MVSSTDHPPSRALAWPGKMIGAARLLAWIALGWTPGPGARAADGPAKVDTSTLQGKVMCGYQGWFRCPGDPVDRGWRHWSRDSSRIAPGTLSFEMWPDMTEATPGESFPAPGFHFPDGRPATLFSSAHPGTVDRHFRWMEQYGIDGVFAQRFLVDLDQPEPDRVLNLVRESAGKTGRAFAVGYDLSGMPADRLLEVLAGDWKRLVDRLGVTGGDRYLRHAGKPVVFVWGFFPDRFGAPLAHRIIDIFQGDDRYGATIVGGTPWYWRSGRDPEWARAFRRLDVISPWNVGNVAIEGGRKEAATGSWKDDLAEAKGGGMAYLPVIYPGFAWTNLKGPEASAATIPRAGGAFYWHQFARVSTLGIDMAYVAMFDEVDEATAIFKVTNTPPSPGHFATFDGLPADWYLRLTGEGSRLIRGERPNTPEIPIRP